MSAGLQNQALPSRDDIRAWKIKAAKAAEEAGDAERAEEYRWECERLLGFTEYRYPRYRTSKVHRFLCEQLERVERGEVDRMMIRMPPRHGKTEIAAKSFPAHMLGRDPRHQFLCASASV